MKYLQRTQQTILVIAVLYSLYLIKAGLGIDISHKYHLGDLFIRPVEVVKAAVHKALRSTAKVNPPAIVRLLPKY